MDKDDKTQINIRNVPVQLVEKAKQIAKQQDRQFSQVVRQLLREYVEENDKKKQPNK